MNSSFDMNSLTIEIDQTRSKSIDDDQYEDDSTNPQSGTHISRSSITNTNISNNGLKRTKDISPCYVCGAKAHGYNFDQSNEKQKNFHKNLRLIIYFILVTCESCKAFFRRNALKSMVKKKHKN
jgi:hypothetical protein